jgi:electron transport complex protein RnfG
MKNETLKLGLILFVISAIAAFLLAFTNDLTKDTIEKAIEAESNGPVVANVVVPGATSIEEFDKELVDKIKSENEKFIDLRQLKDESGQLIGYGISTKSPIKGYGGDIEIILGISLDAKISGIKIVSHAETAGLGSNIEKPAFLKKFIGKSAIEQFTVTKSVSKETDVESIGGATYSTESFASAVNNAIEIYNKYIAGGNHE